MKTKLGMIGIAIGFMVAITSCDNNPITNGNTADTIKSGTWRITYYYDTDHEETSSFSGYNFTFAAAGTVTASDTVNTINGTWSTGTDDSQPKLILDFGTQVPF